MVREFRYTVLKNSDIEKAIHYGDLPASAYATLSHIVERVRISREERGKAPLETVVVESDWPEYEPTWKAIEERVSAQESYL